MKFFIALIVAMTSVSSFASELTCGYGQYPSENWPERTDVVRKAVVNGEVVLEVSHPKVISTIYYSVSTEILNHTFTLPEYDVTEESSVTFPFWNHTAYVSPIHGTNSALYCWFE